MSIYIALVHFPVYNNRKKIVNTALTCISVHDIARVARTYNIKKFFVINPLKSQQELLKRILTFWNDGDGLNFNDNRTLALSIVKGVRSLLEAYTFIKNESNNELKIIGTSAKSFGNIISYSDLHEILIKGDRDYLILFGTGWGLTDEIMLECDYILEPVSFGTDFNHLSVRSAVSII
ncbi:MAG TPA: RNA methyltransferase [Firmicutes bacterium]|nr:RNA methyltransferase [Bacillota bacterium]